MYDLFTNVNPLSETLDGCFILSGQVCLSMTEKMMGNIQSHREVKTFEFGCDTLLMIPNLS